MNIPTSVVNTVIGVHGTLVNWYSKVTGSIDPYDVSSQSFGYGDPVISLISGSFTAVIMPGVVDEKLIEPGYYLEDYRRLYVRAGDAPNYFDYVSFGGQLRLVLPTQERFDSGRTIFKKILTRVLIPSGSNQILPSYLAQVQP